MPRMFGRARQCPGRSRARVEERCQVSGTRVRIRCTYPGPGLEPTEVEFEPGAGLGRTPDMVRARIAELLQTRAYVELPVADGAPIPIHRRTVSEVVVEP